MVILVESREERKRVQKTVDVEAYVRTYFADVPELINVARCESTFRHYNGEGDVLRGIVNKSDVGVMQINVYYHGDRAEKLGYDLHTIEGNTAFARKLYEREGLQPWRASKPCWSRSHELAQR